MIATAGEASCAEDLADGDVLFGGRVINPFAGTVPSSAAEALLSDE
ncbi:PIN domain-containing protein [Rhodopila globiformis]|nr:PIN domain-containing protein [Rhodopila globiformis]